MEESTCFGKLIDISNGTELYIRKIPCVLGRSSNTDNMNYEDKKLSIGKTIDVDLNYCNLSEINDYYVKQKLIIENCKRISPAHIIIYFDFKSKEFKLRALNSFYFNETLVGEETNSAVLKSFDKIGFDCTICTIPHIYVIVFAKNKNDNYNNYDGFNWTSSSTNALAPILNTTNENINKIQSNNLNKRIPDMILANKWTSHEKDCLRKYILIYGYGRWKMLKQNSGGVLSEKREIEIKIFSNAFIKTIIEFIPQEKSELRKFLITLIDENIDEPFILSKKDDWGTLIKQRAPAWGKRIQLLFRVCLIVEKFKQERKRNKEIRKKGEDNHLDQNEVPSNNDDINMKTCSININKTYDYWDNLLNFLPNHAFYGQRPSIWWTRTHDIDLLRGTYKYGYANYQLMRMDQKLSFSKLEKDSSFQEFPNADTITRRLKKLIQIIIKSESSNGVISFDDRKSMKEPTGFNLEEKNDIVQYLIDRGVSLNHEGKSDWFALKDSLVKAINMDNQKPPQAIERLIQRLRMISQLVIQLNDNASNDNEVDIDDNMLEQMDPDNDGFNISHEEAEKLNKNMNILHFIRKYVLSDNMKLFNNALNNLIEASKNYSTNTGINLPEGYDCSLHDKILLKAVEEKGFSYLTRLVSVAKMGTTAAIGATANVENIVNTGSISNETENYCSFFSNIDWTHDDALMRINYLCEFFRDFSSGNKSKKKKDSNIINSLNLALINQYDNREYNAHIMKKKTTKLNIEYDEDGKLIYPININSSLQILNLGRIEYEKSAYHTEKNLFPIGFKATREHGSTTKLGGRALYTCEILDGGAKPMYKLTPHEESENPIIKESSTGCWIVVCNRINALQGNRRNKVTISGTERFGLCDNNVVKLLQSLPGTDKCSKYIMKTFEEV